MRTRGDLLARHSLASSSEAVGAAPLAPVPRRLAYHFPPHPAGKMKALLPLLLLAAVLLLGYAPTADAESKFLASSAVSPSRTSRWEGEMEDGQFAASGVFAEGQASGHL